MADFSNSFLQGADTDQILATGESMQDSFSDYLTHGTVSAITSAAVSFYNTGVALGESLGFADADSYIDTVDAVNSVFGEQTADFYRRNKDGVDLVGFIAGSLIPGGVAIKALRAAQTAGKLTKGMQLATGMKNADLVLGSPAMKAATETVLKQAAPNLNNPAVWRAYGRGLQQQVLEGVVAETAVLLTMNQAPTVNSEGLGYFEAVKSQALSGTPYVLGGAALGGGLEVFRVRGALKRAWDKEFTRTADLANPELPNLYGMTPGDQIVMTARTLDDFRHNPRFAVDEGDEFAKKQKAVGEGIINKAIETALTDVNATGSTDAIRVMQGILRGDDTGRIDFDKLDSLLSGLSAVRNFSTKEGEQLFDFYSKTRSTSFVAKAGIYSNDEAGIISRGELADYLYDQMGHKIGIDREKFRTNFIKRNKLDGEGANGFAYADSVFNPADPNNPATFAFQIADAQNGLIINSATNNMDTLKPGSLELRMSVDMTNNVRKSMGLPQINEDEMVDLIMLHEITHAKANTVAHIKSFWERATSAAKGGKRATKFMEEMVNLSRSRRAAHWESIAFLEQDMIKAYGGNKGQAWKAMATGDFGDLALEYAPDVRNRAQYLFHPNELIADAGAQLTLSSSREAAAKLAPSVATYMNKYGGIAKAFTPKRAYYNTRTGKTMTSYLPGINDYGKIVFGKNGMSSPTLKRAFTRHNRGFSKLMDGAEGLGEAFKVDHDYLEFSAQWAIAQKADLADFVDDAGNAVLDASDLPMIERLITDPDFTGEITLKGLKEYTTAPADLTGFEEFADVVPTISERVLTKETAVDYLTQQKLRIRGNMITDKFNQFNEHEIAHILNIDVDAAMGFPTDKESLLLMGSRDFGSAEVLAMDYQAKLPDQYKYEAHSMQATQERANVQRELQQQASATVLGDWFNKMLGVDKVNASAAGMITGTETRAGFLSQVRTDFGSIREMASYIGNITRQAKNKVNQEVVEDFAKHFRAFNDPNAGELRAELSMATNLLNRDWYKLARGLDRDGNTVSYIIKKDLADDINFWGVSSADELPDLADLSEEGLNIVAGAKRQGDHGALELSDQVADFFEMHQRRNANLIQRKQVVAGAKGKHFTGDPNVLYAPPRDLTKTKFFSFVIPNTFTEGADPRKYMVYGRTAEELAQKVKKIEQSYGGQYKVVTNQEALAYKKLQQEYDSGLVFDEVHFDQGAFRSGTSAELTPNLDIEGSYALERFRNFHHRQEEYLINSGVELKYSEFMGQLKRIDEERSKFQKSTLFAKEQPSSIWEDTVRMMLDDKGTGGELEQLWNRVNDFIGEKGSQVLGDAIDLLRKAVKPGQRLTQDKLDEYNAFLADKGYNPPFKEVTEALVASPNLRDSRLVPSLVKTLNNLTSTMMLRLDMAHNMINVMSAPILLSPVLKEAKEFMKGPGRAQLDELTSVVHPDSGLREPSVMKMMTRATRAFFSDEGKEFLTELRQRGIVADYLQEYVDATDFSMLNGRHTLQTVNHKIEQLARFGGKYTGFTLAEEFTRFVTAHSIKQITDIRGIQGEEAFAIMQSAVDKVHGIYRNTQRSQLFQGPVGQAIGLYQTYFFNFVQNAAKWASDPGRGKLALQASLQGSIFGIQSFPGFHTLNQQIGQANADENFADIYSTLGATEEGSLGQYLLYGLGSHALVTPIDFYSRGDMAIRNALVVPTSPQDFPSVAIISKAIGNMINVTSQLANGAPTGEALLHGLAHNGMNRPLQGLANIALGYTANGRGQKYMDNINYMDYNAANELNFGGMFSRLIGSKPFNESVYMQAYFRSKEYQASMNDSLQKLSTTIQLNRNAGESGNYYDFATQYESIGGDPENFKAYFSRQLTNATQPQIQEFKRELSGDTGLGRLQRRLNSEYSVKPIWEY